MNEKRERNVMALLTAVAVVNIGRDGDHRRELRALRDELCANAAAVANAVANAAAVAAALDVAQGVLTAADQDAGSGMIKAVPALRRIAAILEGDHDPAA